VNLLAYELKSSLYQELATDHHVHSVYAIRPHLLRFGSPAGTLTMEIRDSSGQVMFTSETIAISSIGSGSYWHGYVRFLLSGHLSKFTNYRIGLVAGGGYSFSESGYIAWCNGFDLGKYAGSYANAVGWSAPLDLEIWEYDYMKKGVS
jgi:hypothetical protein